jgi:hypothetical protein
VSDDAPVSSTRPASGGPRRAIRRFRVTVTAGPATGQIWAEAAERCAIGSHPSNDLIVDDPTVSRFHCELAIVGDRVRARDLGSRNGTVAGGIAVTEGAFGGGTTLVLGHSQLRVELDDGQAEITEAPTPVQRPHRSLRGNRRDGAPRSATASPPVNTAAEAATGSDATAPATGSRATTPATGGSGPGSAAPCDHPRRIGCCGRGRRCSGVADRACRCTDPADGHQQQRRRGRARRLLKPREATENTLAPIRTRR